MKLHEYQKVARDYLIEHPVAALLLSPGLGKTIITLVAVELLMYDYFSVRKCLVVAPPRVAQTVWAQEAEKWCLNLRISRVIGTPQQRMEALYRDADVYVISRSCLSWLKEKWAGEFDCVVFDELSSFKDHTSDRSKAARYFGSKARRRIGLTASPAGKSMDATAIDTYLDEEETTSRAAAERVIEARRAVQTAINSVPDPRYQQLLSLRYIEGLRWPAVESELDVDHATGVRWHNAARRHLERNFLKNIL